MSWMQPIKSEIILANIDPIFCSASSSLSSTFFTWVLVGHNWLELLVRILHVAQAEIQAIHERLVVKATVGRKHVEGIAVRERTEIERAFRKQRAALAARALQAREHELLGVGREGGRLLMRRAQP